MKNRLRGLLGALPRLILTVGRPHKHAWLTHGGRGKYYEAFALWMSEQLFAYRTD